MKDVSSTTMFLSTTVQAHVLPNVFSDAKSYKALTQDTVDHAKNCGSKLVVVVVNNINMSSSSATPVAVVIGILDNPLAYMPVNTSNVIDGNDSNYSDSVSTPSLVAMLNSSH